MDGLERSPIYQIKDRLGSGNRIFVMREDLLPPTLGGNKVRIAREFFLDMERKGCDTMVAYGNARSNLCRVIANQCCMDRIPCYVICSGEAEEKSATGNSRIMEMFDAEIVPCTTQNIAATVEGLMERLRGEGRRPYYIYGNKFGEGNEGVAAGAYRKAYGQITRFCGESGVELDYIFHASGTGATQAGLTCGHILAGDHAKVTGILISSREYRRAVSVIRTGLRGALEDAGTPWRGEYESEIILESAFTKGGYGMYDRDITDCIREELRLNGLPLDPVYTGKAFWGMERYIEREKLAGKNILFIHTGGTPLFYDCLNEGKLV